MVGCPLTCEVLGTTESHQHLQSKDANNGDNKAHHEHRQDENFLAKVHLQFNNNRNWKAQNDNIKHNVQGGGCPSLSVDVVASSRVFVIPV